MTTAAGDDSGDALLDADYDGDGLDDLVGTTYAERCASGYTYAVAALGDFDGDDTQDLAVSCKGYQHHDENDDIVHTLAGIWIVPGLASGL